MSDNPQPSFSGAAKRRPEDPIGGSLDPGSSGLRFAPPEDDASLRTHVVSTKREALTHAGRPVLSRPAVGLGLALDDLAAEEAVDEVDEEQRAAAAHVEERVELDDVEGGDEA